MATNSIKTNSRLSSLDITRGITVAGMILVNNGYHGSFEMLRHAEWNGLSFSDLVFPFFLFIMGVSIFLSLSRNKFRADSPTILRIVKRTLVLFLIGIGINWLDMALYGGALNFQELRFWAVLQRIALCYFIVSIFALTFSHRFTVPFAILTLAAYAAIVVLGNGYSTDKSSNILYLADMRIFGDSHLYHKSPVDPEGLLSTISSLANVLFGFYCGMKIKSLGNNRDKALAVFSAAAALIFSGFVLDFFMPVNKHIWSPSFALVTSGLCALLFAAMIKITDINGCTRGWTTFFRIFGTNALALYVSSELIAIVFGKIGINDWIFNLYSVCIPVPQLSSLAYALTYVFLNFAIGYFLWKKKLFIKL